MSFNHKIYVLLIFTFLNTTFAYPSLIEWGSTGTGFVAGSMIAHKIYTKLNEWRAKDTDQTPLSKKNRRRKIVQKPTPSFWYYITILTGGLCGSYLLNGCTNRLFPPLPQVKTTLDEILTYYQNVNYSDPNDANYPAKIYKRASLVLHPDKNRNIINRDLAFTLLAAVRLIYEDKDLAPYANICIKYPEVGRQILDWKWREKLGKIGNNTNKATELIQWFNELSSTLNQINEAYFEKPINSLRIMPS